jgi:hypothetical protein
MRLSSVQQAGTTRACRFRFQSIPPPPPPPPGLQSHAGTQLQLHCHPHKPVTISRWVAAGVHKTSKVRTSDGMFFARAEDAVVKRIEDRVAAWTMLPAGHAEGMQVLRYVVSEGWATHVVMMIGGC